MDFRLLNMFLFNTSAALKMTCHFPISPSLAKEQDSDPPVLKKENVSLQTVPPAAERVSDSSSQEVTSQKPNATPEQVRGGSTVTLFIFITFLPPHYF